MRRIRLTGLALVTALGISGISAAAASAKPPIPVLEEQPTLKPIEPGDPLQLTSDDFEIVTSMGTIQCTLGTIDATLRTNGLKTDTFPLGAISLSGPEGGPCAGTTHLGDATITVEAEEWMGTLSTNGKTELIGNPDLVGNPDLLVEASFNDGTARAAAMRCTWQAAKLKGTFNTDGRAITINEAEEHFGIDKRGSDPGCPKGKTTVSATWALGALGATGELVPAIVGNPNL